MREDRHALDRANDGRDHAENLQLGVFGEFDRAKGRVLWSQDDFAVRAAEPLDGKFAVKRFRRSNGKVILAPENPDDFAVRAAEPLDGKFAVDGGDDDAAGRRFDAAIDDEKIARMDAGAGH